MSGYQTLYVEAVKWLNENEGFLALIIFLVSATFAWFSGIISALQRRPNLNIKAIEGPTLCVVNATGWNFGEYTAHRTCISVYLQVSNAGSAPTSIGNISIGYRWLLRPFSVIWFKKFVLLHWMERETIVLSDFQVELGESGNLKFYPFLSQRSVVSGESAKTYLEIGEMTNGVVYFEEPEAWGGYQPFPIKDKIHIRIRITDAFGGKHYGSASVPLVSISEAKKYNPSFGDSLAALEVKGAKEGENAH